MTIATKELAVLARTIHQMGEGPHARHEIALCLGAAIKLHINPRLDMARWEEACRHGVPSKGEALK